LSNLHYENTYIKDALLLQTVSLILRQSLYLRQIEMPDSRE